MDEIRIPWEDWVLGKKLGQGSFGAVYEIQREITCRTEKSALKIIRFPAGSHKRLQNFPGPVFFLRPNPPREF